MDGNLLWPFGIGMASVLNPCGVAMLPATLAWLAGTAAPTSTGVGRAGKGALAGLAMALGFTSVVLLLALLVHVTGAVFSGYLRIVMIALGAALAGGGVLVAFGLFHLPMARLLHMEGVSLDARRPANPGTMVLAGILYGVAAMSCTLPLFIAVVFPTFSGGLGQTLATVGAFGAGAATLLIAASEGTLFARDMLLRWLRRTRQIMNPLLGGTVAFAGIYLLYYWTLGPGRFI